MYWYGNNWNIVIDEHPEKIEYYALNISPKSEDLSLDHNKVKLFVSKFINDINDYQLRDIITKETKNIRDLLVAKAFSSGEFDEEPPGEFEDFLGTVQ
ncbi:hypothetical protein OA86_10695 [Kaistella jeonii]|uniref:His-Xaa-Ser system protein HxsD n=1 Tax=Kaistella jeonii TaxID=266749 RepID=A0A0C1F9L9_9FLAO|nr:hypothetical protein OA86_10695 [Kaistella jeonii]